MVFASRSTILRPIFITVLFLAGLIVLFSMYLKSNFVPRCPPPPKQVDAAKDSAVSGELNKSAVVKKPLLLLWSWPEGKTFDFKDCKTDLHIDHCQLTDDRSLYSAARAVLIYHNDISDDLTNLPTSPRPKFQRWIWLGMDTPPNTRRIAGINAMFNLTSSYRKDSDIPVRWFLTTKKVPDDEFVPPKKERLLCWVVNSDDLKSKTGESYSYYGELTKHIKVDVLESSDKRLKGDNYFHTLGTCKFFLAFEESTQRDYITETFNGPLASGTVPVVLGPPRKNYEKFAPGTSFVHVNDFPDAFELAEFLIKLDEDDEAYKRYFTWRQFFHVDRHFHDENRKFALAICQACRHVGSTNEYRVVPDLYKWLLQ